MCLLFQIKPFLISQTIAFKHMRFHTSHEMFHIEASLMAYAQQMYYR